MLSTPTKHILGRTEGSKGIHAYRQPHQTILKDHESIYNRKYHEPRPNKYSHMMHEYQHNPMPDYQREQLIHSKHKVEA